MRTELIEYEPNTQREDEDAREQRWAEFIEWLRRPRQLHSWGDMLINVGHTMERGPVLEYERRFVDFAETEGWHGVLTAIASAMVADDKARRELVDRR